MSSDLTTAASETGLALLDGDYGNMVYIFVAIAAIYFLMDFMGGKSAGSVKAPAAEKSVSTKKKAPEKKKTTRKRSKTPEKSANDDEDLLAKVRERKSGSSTKKKTPAKKSASSKKSKSSAKKATPAKG